MKLKLVIGSALVLFAATLTAEAQPTPVINHREHNQVRRINQGVRSGELTPSESAHLRARERSIRADKRIAKQTGTLSPGKRARLRHREARLSRAIYRKKHNRRVY